MYLMHLIVKKIKFIAVIGLILTTVTCELSEEEQTSPGVLALAGIISKAGLSSSRRSGSGSNVVSTPVFSLSEGTYSSDQNLKISTDTPDAIIYYTTDDSIPDESSESYATPIPITGNKTVLTIQAIAMAEGFEDSEIATVRIEIDYNRVSTPQFSPVAGDFDSDQLVEITVNTGGAKIYYTTNGDTPTESSTLYESAISISGDEGGKISKTIQAIGIKTGLNDSTVAEATYSITYPAAATPVFLPTTGSYSSDQDVAISTTTPGGKIYYTTDLSTPTAASNLYSGTIPVHGDGNSRTIKAVTIATGYSISEVAEATISINYMQVSTPQFFPGAGTYSSGQEVTISTDTDGADIYYTTNGDTPTTASTHYTIGIPIVTTTTLKAIAVKTGLDDSTVAEATFTIADPAETPVMLPAGGTYDVDQSVSLSTTTPGATIYYTTDESTPTTDSNVYSIPISISGDGTTRTIKAIAVASGYSESEVVSALYEIDYDNTRAATPVILPATGNYESGELISMTSESGATIYYTTDGSTPNGLSEEYIAPFPLEESMIVKAIAIKSPLSPSYLASQSYKVSQVSQVRFYPSPGSYVGEQIVKLSTSTEGASIYYTKDGSPPTTSSIPYSGGVTVSDSSTLKAIAVKTGYNDSPIGKALYYIDTGGANYSVGGWVSGLYGGTLVLNNGADSLTLTQNGPFTFSLPVADGGAYTITIASQPASQTCRVDTNNTGSGTGGTVSGAHVRTIGVTCFDPILPVAESGQTQCFYYNAGAWTLDAGCLLAYPADPFDVNYPAGQDADQENPELPIARSYLGPEQHGTYSGNYTTTDEVTGLIWKTCLEGFSGSLCETEVIVPLTWIQAGERCNSLNLENDGEGYAGRTDWRLPVIEELESLTDFSVYPDPALDSDAFPNTYPGAYWSATASIPIPANIWKVHFAYGDSSNLTARTASMFTRCVAGP